MKTLHKSASHPSGGLARRSWSIAAMVVSGYVVVGPKGARIPKKDGDGAMLRFLMPRAVRHWLSEERMAVTESGLVLTAAGLNEVNDSLTRSEGYHADAEAIAAFTKFITTGEAVEVAGVTYKSATSAGFGK